MALLSPYFLTARGNFFIGRELRRRPWLGRLGLLDERRMRRKWQERLDALQVRLDASSGWPARELRADALDAAVAAAEGSDVPREWIIPVTVGDKTNAASWEG
jgi:hypothetical protein